MQPTDDQEQLDRAHDALANAIDSLEKRLPSSEDIAWLRNRRIESERASWAWQKIKKWAPWVSVAASLFGAAVTWLATHTISIGPKP